MPTSTDDEYVTIHKSRYEDLLEAERWLGCLEEAGVDNWEGVSHAHDLYQEEDED